MATSVSAWKRPCLMLDRLKELGFLYATKSGVSIGISDMVIPSVKFKLVDSAEHEVVKVQQQYLDGAITNGERYNKVIAIWSDVTEKVADEMFKALEEQDKQGMINPSTSWPIPEPAVRNSRSASFPACAD
jgi:DNA-directed RNA polymerase subunit beta'